MIGDDLQQEPQTTAGRRRVRTFYGHAAAPSARRALENMLKVKAKETGHRITAAEDKAYDTADHVAALRQIGVMPHVAQNNFTTKTGKTRKSAIDERTTSHDDYNSLPPRNPLKATAWLRCGRTP